MSNEIATYSMILSKLSLGKSGTECPTKTQILAINSLIVIENASTYGANECVKIDDIRKKVETWNYYLTVSPTSMSFGAGGGSKSFTVSSYKRKVLDGVEQSGDTSVSLKSTVISGSGFSLSGTTVSASANEITSNRTGTVTITQNESNKTATISLSQSGDDVSSYGEWVITVSANPTSVSSSGGTSTITASAKRTIYWESGDVTEETGNPTLSTNLGSLSSTASPSTLTLGENASTSSRTATITASYSGKSATCTVTQSGATPSTTYTFSINPYKVNVGSSGGSGSVTISSYKTVSSSTYDVDYSIDSSTLPSWASFNKSTSTFTIQSTTSTTGRTAKVYFDQDESGKRDYAELTQTGYTPPADNYVFTWDDGSTSDISANFPWNFSANGTAANILVVSTKNGSSQSWSVSSKPSWITTSTTSSKVTISASDNSGSARSGIIVLTQSGSNKTLRINVSQEAKATDEYYLGVRKSGETSSYESITFNNVPAKTTNWSGDYTWVSRKNGVFFDNVSFSANVSWITVNSNGGYTVAHNTSGLPRQGTITLTQGESGLKCYVNIYQQKYIPTHGMRVSPSSIRVSSSAQNVNFSVDSYKTVLHSDGSETEESVDYTFSTDSKWFTYYGNTTNTTGIVITSNITTSQRSATFTLTQVGGKSKGIVTVTQEAAEEPSDFFTVTPSSQTVRSNSATAVVNSSSPWTAKIGSGTIYSKVSPTSGSAGSTTITISDSASQHAEVSAVITRTSPSYKEITATVIFAR